VTVIEKAFDELINRLDTAEESLRFGICQYKCPKLKSKEKKRMGKKKKNVKEYHCGTTTKGVSYAQRNTSRKRERKRSNI